MSRNISVSDDVYHRLKRGKGERSFSEVSTEMLERGGQLADVTGQQVIDPETVEEVSEEIERLSEGTLERLADETP